MFGDDACDGLCLAALRDLREDLADLERVASATNRALRAVKTEILSARRHLEPLVYREVVELLGAQIGRYDDEVGELRASVELARHASPSLHLIERIDALKWSHSEILRARQATSAALMVATDWHSPSISHSARSFGGRYTDRVCAYVDDYKRDRHPDQADLEGAWLREYVDNPHQHDLRVLLFGCGMSAFSTVVALLAARDDGRPLVMGASTYHECRQLIEASSLAGRLTLIDESDTRRAVDTIREQEPFAVVLDTLCNAAPLGMPDVEAVVRGLSGRGQRSYLVLDNTSLSVTFQPWRLLPASRSALRMIVVESATKYAQFGFDRTAAGVVVTRAHEAAELDELREHAGANIGDVAARQLPRPDRAGLQRRLRRIGRNAALLAAALDHRIRRRSLPATVVYPGLKDHPCSDRARRSSFRGGFLALNPARRAPEVRPQLVQAALDEARARGVPLVEGTSFGFDVSRIYCTADHTRFGTPFVRIAAGTEHRLGIAKVGDALSTALERVCGNL